MANKSDRLNHFIVIKNREDFVNAWQSDFLRKIREHESALINATDKDTFKVDGYCVPCSQNVSFLVDMQSGGQFQDNVWLPNWRERLECPLCKMNNRQRLISTLIKQELDVLQEKQVYLMEQVTPIYNWVKSTFKNHTIVGSEYLGHEYPCGEIVEGIRHEDIENMSFSNNTLDLIVSNDVFEHVPNPAKAFAECARVLKAGGVMIATIPFHCNSDKSITRAKVTNGQLEHILTPEYHGNPISGDGSLVFTDFSWDILKEMQVAGFSDISIEVYASLELGHLGGGQLVFRANKEVCQLYDAGNEDYQKKLMKELEVFENNVNVHDLSDIYHYWSNKYIAPMFQEAGFNSIAEFFSSNLLAAKNRTGSVVANFVSVGAGSCDLEVSVAKNLVDAGFKDFIFECLEINSVMLDRGKEIARESSLLSNMCFVEADFNTWVAGKKYDGVMANQSLHHVTSLEHLFDQINKALHDDGSFVISDMIGRNGHQRWPESLAIVNKFWKELPKNYKFNVLLNRLEDNEYENWDCSTESFEGIRAQDILPLLLKQFECEKFIGFGSAIDIFVDRCFGHNFNSELDYDRDFIDRVHAEDEAAIISGKLTPTHLLGIFVKKLHTVPYFSHGINPHFCIRRYESKNS